MKTKSTTGNWWDKLGTRNTAVNLPSGPAGILRILMSISGKLLPVFTAAGWKGWFLTTGQLTRRCGFCSAVAPH